MLAGVVVGLTTLKLYANLSLLHIWLNLTSFPQTADDKYCKWTPSPISDFPHNIKLDFIDINLLGQRYATTVSGWMLFVFRHRFWLSTVNLFILI